MQTTPSVVLRGMSPSAVLDADIRQRLARLERFYPSIVSARVLVELRSRHRQDGNRIHVRVELAVPGQDVIVSHDASLRPALRARGDGAKRKQDEVDPGHRHAKVAVREAFEVARRRLQDHARRQRGAVKTHTPPPEGRVIRLFRNEGYGFIRAADGHEVYFQKAAVLGSGFPRVRVGSQVAFAEEAGHEGPQASSVKLAR